MFECQITLIPGGKKMDRGYQMSPDELVELSANDATREGLAKLRRANEKYRRQVWPAPFCETEHRFHLGDARDLSWLRDESVHLIVTSPPYWTLKKYADHKQQMGSIVQYEEFLAELDKVWKECARLLVPGGRICCVVGDACVPRKKGGKHYVAPLHSDIQVQARRNDLDCLTPIIWHKIANGVTEAKGNGAGFYGKPFQPGAVVKNDIEYVLFLRKGGEYRKPTPLQKALSVLTKEEMQSWWRSIWTDIKGASTRSGHPAPFPSALAERLIRMFSFAGDIVFDPFAGTGSTSVAALVAGRGSISNEIEPAYMKLAIDRVRKTAKEKRMVGAVKAAVIVDRATRVSKKSETNFALSSARPISSSF